MPSLWGILGCGQCLVDEGTGGRLTMEGASKVGLRSSHPRLLVVP
jgi:hypothetical protein